MAGKNQVTLTFAGDSKNLEKSFDNVGQGARRMGDAASDQASKIDRLGEAGGNTETHFLGLGAGISGVSTLLSGDLNAETAAMAIADLGDSVEHALVPMGKIILKYAEMGLASLVAAGKMALAWLIGLGPIGIVILAIGAIIAILAALGIGFDDIKEIAGKVWDFIKKAASKVWDWLKENWPKLLAILTGPFGLAVLAIAKHKDKILDFIKAIPGKIKDFLSGIGEIISDAFGAGFRGIKRLWNNTIGGFGFTAPSWIPGIGGKGFHIPEMHTGGIVPGAPGQETLAMLQAGERVSPAGASGGSIVIDMRGAIVADSRQFEQMVVQAVRSATGKGVPLTVRGRAL